MGAALLYISHAYPRGGGSGSHRTARFARRLSGCGWEVIVLCGPAPAGVAPHPADPFRVVSVHDPFDRALAGPASRGGKPQGPSREGPPSRLRRFLRQVCFIPDPQLFWLPSALSAARRIRRELPVAAILCSGPPFSVFLVGRLLKTLWRVPLVLDYRDVWLEHPWWPVPAWRRGIETRMERHLLLAADLVVANHEAMLRAFLERNPRIADRSIIVPNGFDPDELGPPARPAWRPGERFEFVYAGTLYGPIADRSPRSEPLSVQRPVGFFRALRQLSERRAFGPGGARVVFVGARAGTEEAANLMACAHDCGVADMVQVLARMEKSEVIPILRRAHILLNILYYTEAQVAQKVYEYLHFEIPILSMLRDSEANATIVRQARAGPVVDPADVAGIVTAIERLVRDYAAGRPPIVNDRSFIDRFDAREQARLLDARLRGLLGRPRDGALRHDRA